MHKSSPSGKGGRKTLPANSWLMTFRSPCRIHQPAPLPGSQKKKRSPSKFTPPSNSTNILPRAPSRRDFPAQPACFTKECPGGTNFSPFPPLAHCTSSNLEHIHLHGAAATAAPSPVFPPIIAGPPSPSRNPSAVPPAWGQGQRYFARPKGPAAAPVTSANLPRSKIKARTTSRASVQAMAAASISCKARLLS